MKMLLYFIDLSVIPEIGELPSWADPDLLKGLSVAAIALVVVGTWLIFRVVRKVVFRSLLLVLAVGLSFSLWQQRGQLTDCVETCSCDLFGQTVQIPIDKNPNCE